MPFSAWHRRLIAILGPAHFFDAFDATSLAVVLPVLVGLWHLRPAAVGSLIAVGYVGQMIGAIGFGILSERFGRIRVLRWAIAILSGFSFACGFASGYPILLALRALQGVGLGAEVPIVATYVNEVSSSRYRGAIGGSFQFLFAIGTVVASVSAALIVPRYGWPILFLLGALPLILAVSLPLLLPESPRWLASRGRGVEANAAVASIEGRAHEGVARLDIFDPQRDNFQPNSRSERGGVRALFAPSLARGTVSAWLMAFCCSLVGYGIVGWMPTVYRTVYAVPVSTALIYSSVTGMCSLIGAGAGIIVLDCLGRKASMAIGFCGASAALLTMALLNVHVPTVVVMVLASVAMAFLALPLCGIYVYGPEIYPTRVRALGMGVISAWLRIGSIVGPSLIGLILTFGHIVHVFILFTSVAVVGAIGTLVLAVETKM